MKYYNFALYIFQLIFSNYRKYKVRFLRCNVSFTKFWYKW